MKLSALLDATSASDIPPPIVSLSAGFDPDINGLTADSRRVEQGSLFAAIKGYGLDGRDYIPHAVEKGAVAILSDDEATIPDAVAAVRDHNPRACLARFAAGFFGAVPEALYGVTGTNGKTSTAYFAAQVFDRLGHRAASVGTLGALSANGDINLPIGHTTPDPVTLHDALAQLRAGEIKTAVLEASSHGLAQDRLAGLKLDGAAFSNITHDHLDYHNDFADYFDAKAKLFRACVKSGGFAVINMDGAGADEMVQSAREVSLKVITTGKRGDDFKLTHMEPTVSGLDIRVAVDGSEYIIHLPFIGAFQAQNVLLAAGLAVGAGFPGKDVIETLSSLSAPPGRMQRAWPLNGRDANSSDGGWAAYVDYAHTPDAIAAAIAAIRPHTVGRVIAVVGAGGDRDAAKRAPMGRAGTIGADHLIITDDNPRSEDPAIIRAEVVKGAQAVASEQPTPIQEIGDRCEAIKAGIAALSDGDVLLVLGKGHETGQVIGDKVLPFDDVKEIETVAPAIIRTVGKGLS